ncbi:two-component sensor histidine kinase [Emticicia aquatilis]|uniref:histidine kinase n=1 Tax=Emticicia aquatilis TaxID=1537369 RepID=A0A917DLT6_9BACT|nr:ATP-binding protein [Emticicia aquatilis]GGD49571.1 two-component sensor histidine kinase [Emticicia aquatilis]
MPKDSNYVRTAEQYAWKLLNYLDDEKKAEKILHEADKIALKINDYKGVARINWNFGILYLRYEKLNEALNSFQKSENYVNKYNLSPNEKQLVYSGLGTYYEFVNQYDNAFKYITQAIELTEKFHLSEYILPAYIIMARMYIPIDVKKYEVYTKKSILLIEKEKNKQARYLAELALSDFYVQKKDYLKSKYHSQKSLFYAKNYCRPASIISSWISLSSIYIRLNQLDSAYNYINMSVKLAEKLNNDFRKADAYASMAMYYEFKKQYKLAEKYNLKTLEIDKKGNYGLGVKLDYDKLADLNLLLKDYKKAHDYRVKSYKLEDSLFSLKLSTSVNRLEKEKQEANLKLLKLENENSIFQRNVFLIVGILSILLGIISIVLIINRNKYKKLEAEQRLRNQIAADLHDEIGSTLSSISILSEIVTFQQKKGDSKLEIMQQVSNDAREVIDKMDDIIWAINPQNDSLQNLETRLKSYAIPIFESKEIEFKIDFLAISENIKIDISKRRDIYLILKEAINNLIKYSNSKNAVIEAKLENKFIVFEIIDNGIGFDINAASQRNGLKNMKMRAEKIGATLNINSTISKGTQVILTVPL